MTSKSTKVDQIKQVASQSNQNDSTEEKSRIQNSDNSSSIKINKQKNRNNRTNQTNQNKIRLSPEKVEALFKYYSDLKYKLLNSVFKWTIKVLAVVFSVTMTVSLLCSVLDSKLHCATIMPSNMVTAWIIFSITTFVIMLGIIFLFTTDGKEISKALIDTNKLIIDNKSFFGKILSSFQKKDKLNSFNEKSSF